MAPFLCVLIALGLLGMNEGIPFVRPDMFSLQGHRSQMRSTDHHQPAPPCQVTQVELRWGPGKGKVLSKTCLCGSPSGNNTWVTVHAHVNGHVSIRVSSGRGRPAKSHGLTSLSRNSGWRETWTWALRSILLTMIQITNCFFDRRFLGNYSDLWFLAGRTLEFSLRVYSSNHG